MNTRDPGAVVLDCRRCGAQITAENINLATALAKCHHCHAVFGFADQLSGARPAPRPLDMPLPAGLTLSRRKDLLQLVRRWFRRSLFLQLFFCIAWDAFLVLWYVGAANHARGGALMLFASVHLALGVGLTYATIAGFLNRTVIEVGRTHLAIRHTPVPWRGNLEVLVSELQQIFCEEHVKRVMSDLRMTYSVNAVMGNGRKLTLVKDLPEVDQALFLEQALEKHLGIRNRPVPGEFRR